MLWSVVREIAELLAGASFYLGLSWHTYKRYPGNKLVRFGSLTLGVFTALAILSEVPNLPDWVPLSLILLVFLLCLLTLFFLLQRGWRALYRRKPRRAADGR